MNTNKEIEIIRKEYENNPVKLFLKIKNSIYDEKQLRKIKPIRILDEYYSYLYLSKIEENEYKEFLLYGVTGSGKTEIYLQLIQKVLENQKTAIVLVPEISLTPQMLDRFIARFGKEQIAVLHSKLSIGERHDEWNKIKEKDAKIVIRSKVCNICTCKRFGNNYNR